MSKQDAASASLADGQLASSAEQSAVSQPASYL